MSKLTNAVRADVKRHAKQKRAIKGEIKPELEFKALCAVAHDCNKTLWREIHFCFGYEQEEDPGSFREEIIECVQAWILEHLYSDKIGRILDLDQKTRRWLSNNGVAYWHDALCLAKKPTGLIPKTLANAAKVAVCESIIEQICSLGNGDLQEMLFGDERPTIKDIQEVFFVQYAEFSEDIRFKKLRNKAIQDVRKAVEHLPKLLDQLEVKDKRSFPPKWIKGSKAIMDNLKKKGNRHFLELYWLLKEGRVRHTGTIELTQKRRWKGEGGKLPVLSKADYHQAKKETGLEAQQVRRYLQEMVRHGIVKKMGKDGVGGQVVYSLGYWAKGYAKFPRPVFYLKQTQKMKEALRNFDANYALKE